MSLNPILFIISQIGIRPAFGANDGSINSGVMQSILTNFLLLFRFTISDSLFRRFFVLCWVHYTRSGVYCVGCFPGKFKTNRRIQVVPCKKPVVDDGAATRLLALLVAAMMTPAVRAPAAITAPRISIVSIADAPSSSSLRTYSRTRPVICQ